jgi:quercetin dioxygenase-like cupin family protein
MPLLIKSSAAPTFEMPPSLSVLGLAAPSRGARETCVWRVTLAPETPPTPHALDREEIFVALAGEARVELGGREEVLGPGDALIVPAGETFSLWNPGKTPFTALAVQPVGGRAQLPGGEPFSPPWVL